MTTIKADLDWHMRQKGGVRHVRCLDSASFHACYLAHLGQEKLSRPVDVCSDAAIHDLSLSPTSRVRAKVQ